MVKAKKPPGAGSAGCRRWCRVQVQVLLSYDHPRPMGGLLKSVLQVKKPITWMDLGGMEAMQAVLNMDPWLDKAFTIATLPPPPLLLVLITMPVTITRTALLGLDCIVLRQDVTEDMNGSLQSARQGLGYRVSMALVCDLLGAVITSIIVISAAAAIAAKLTS